MARWISAISFLISFQCFGQTDINLVVAPTAMNVFYRGLANPMEVAVAGVPDSNLIVRISNADSISHEGHHWKVWPGKGPTCYVHVSYTTNGDTLDAGKKEFRVKNVPDPKPYFGGKTGIDDIPYKYLLAAAGVIAKMENFEFDLRFQILSYDFVSDTGTGQVVIHCDGPALNPEVNKVRNKLRHGGEVSIRNIQALGPDGTQRQLEDIRLAVIPTGSMDFHYNSPRNCSWVAWNIYRSAQPSREDFESMAQTASKNILNLRRFNPDDQRMKDAPLTLYHLPIKTRKMTERDLVAALKSIDNTHYNIVVHCKYGADRTGAVIAAYRVIYNNWSKDSAIEEMRNPKYGFHEKLFPNLIELIEDLDVEGIRNELGVGR